MIPQTQELYNSRPNHMFIQDLPALKPCMARDMTRGRPKVRFLPLSKSWQCSPKGKLYLQNDFFDVQSVSHS